MSAVHWTLNKHDRSSLSVSISHSVDLRHSSKSLLHRVCSKTIPSHPWHSPKTTSTFATSSTINWQRCEQKLKVLEEQDLIDHTQRTIPALPRRYQDSQACPHWQHLQQPLIIPWKVSLLLPHQHLPSLDSTLPVPKDWVLKERQWKPKGP